MKRGSEVTVGILITVAVVVLVLGSLWLAHGGLKSGYPLYTRFMWGQNLKQGQPVLLAGVSVGYVDDVTLRPGYLDVMIRIDDKFKIPKGSKTSVVPVGIFGDVAVGLTPPVPLPTESYSPGDTVPPGPPAPDLNQIMSRVDTIGSAVLALTKAIQSQVVDAGTLKDMHKLIASTAEASAELHGILIEQNRNLTETMASVRESASRLGHVVDSAQVTSAIDSLKLVASNTQNFVSHLDSTNVQFQRLLNQVQSPNGTIGKVLTDSLLYRDFRHTLLEADSLLADIRKNPKKYINVHIF